MAFAAVWYGIPGTHLKVGSPTCSSPHAPLLLLRVLLLQQRDHLCDAAGRDVAAFVQHRLVVLHPGPRLGELGPRQAEAHDRSEGRVVRRPDHGPDGDLYCPCHEGEFDIRTGEVTGGPPPRALPKVLLVEDARGAVWAVGTARSGEDEAAGLCRGLRERDPDLARRIGCDS